MSKEYGRCDRCGIREALRRTWNRDIAYCSGCTSWFFKAELLDEFETAIHVGELRAAKCLGKGYLVLT